MKWKSVMSIISLLFRISAMFVTSQSWMIIIKSSLYGWDLKFSLRATPRQVSDILLFAIWQREHLKWSIKRVIMKFIVASRDENMVIIHWDKRCVDARSFVSDKSPTTKSVPVIPMLANCLVRELSALRRSTLLWTYSATIVCQCWLQCVSFWLIMIFGMCVFDVRWCKQRASLHIRWMRARKLPRIVSVWSNRAEIYFNLSCSLGRCAYWSISITTKRIITQNNSNQAEQTLLDISLSSRRLFLFFFCWAAPFQYACVHSIFALFL